MPECNETFYWMHGKEIDTDTVLSAEDERAVSTFKKAAERRRAGKSDQDPLALD